MNDECSLDSCDEYQRMLASLKLYQPPAEVRRFILDAYNADPVIFDWHECDGCTLVSEAHFPEGFRFPPCVGHDHACALEQMGVITRRHGDKLFRKAMKAYGCGFGHRWRRWFGVRVGWLAWGYWKQRYGRES